MEGGGIFSLLGGLPAITAPPCVGHPQGLNLVGLTPFYFGSICDARLMYGRNGIHRILFINGGPLIYKKDVEDIFSNGCR